MVTREQIKKTIKEFSTMYNLAQVDMKLLIDVWYKNLKDTDIEVYNKAVKKLVMEKETYYFPPVGELAGKINKIKNEFTPKEKFYKNVSKSQLDKVISNLQKIKSA